MTTQAFNAEVEKRGWKAVSLGIRWGLSSRRIFQILRYKEGDRPLYYDDAVRKLPTLKDGQEAAELEPMPPELFREEVESRGWNVESLAARWALSKRRVQQILAYDATKRPLYYDDAVRNLPARKVKRAP